MSSSSIPRRLSPILKGLICVLIFLTGHLASAQKAAEKIKFFPKNGSTQVNPDTYLQLTFAEKPTLHNTGTIRIYDASDDSLVDELDLAISPGPKNTRTPAPYDKFVYDNLPDTLYRVNSPDLDSTHRYQIDYIGGNLPVDAYHFYPVLVGENSVKIFPHHNKLEYDKVYYVLVEGGIFSTEAGVPFEIKDKKSWRFHTKKSPPAQDSKTITVSADGKGDFTTVQGAIDFIPEHNTTPMTVSIKKGAYNEIINCRNRNGISFLGEDRDEVLIQYPNNGVFNMRQMSPDPKLNRSSHNIRAVMAIYNSNDITLAHMTLRSVGDEPAQAEALLVNGDRITVEDVAIEGSGDALQATGRIYVTDSKIQGFGDNVLGYGAVFFNRCEFVSTYGPHLWVRNTQENHGNVLVDCVLRTIGEVETDIARAPDSNGKQYPFVEAVLIDCKVEGIRASGWGKVTEETAGIRYWEYNTTSLETGQAVDVSQRNPVSRQRWKKTPN